MERNKIVTKGAGKFDRERILGGGQAIRFTQSPPFPRPPHFVPSFFPDFVLRVSLRSLPRFRLPLFFQQTGEVGRTFCAAGGFCQRAQEAVEGVGGGGGGEDSGLRHGFVAVMVVPMRCVRDVMVVVLVGFLDWGRGGAEGGWLRGRGGVERGCRPRH